MNPADITVLIASLLVVLVEATFTSFTMAEQNKHWNVYTRGGKLLAIALDILFIGVTLWSAIYLSFSA